MSVSASPARPWALARVRVGALSALAGVVASSFVLRTLAAWLRATPTYFPDEYVYSELARSLAESGRPLVRGASASFPALLQPILTAPAWLVDDVETAYRLAQTTGALVMSLAAVPVFLLARQLGLGPRFALAAAAIALAVPDLVYSSALLAEPIAYPLVLGAVAAGTAALARPGMRPHAAFVALTALAAFARLQFAVLPLCFLAAVLIVGARERRLRGALREQLVPLGVFAAFAAVVLATGPARVLGYYRGILGADVDTAGIVRWASADAMVVLYASGWILVPGALLGLALSLRRPRSRAELGFGGLVLPLALALLVEAGFVSAMDTPRVLERYVFYLLPLVVVSFGLYAARGWPSRLAHAVLACALVTLSAVVPLAGYAAADGKTDSPFLQAVFSLEQRVDDVATGSLAVSVVAAVFAAVGVAASVRPRLGTPVVVALAAVACLATSAGAVVHDVRRASYVRGELVPSNSSWLDEKGPRELALLHAEGASRAGAMEQLFWNRSLDTVLLLPEADEVDPFHAGRVEIGGDGELSVDGRAIEQTLVVDESAVTVHFRGATRVASEKSYTVWDPDGAARLSLYAIGRSHDAWLSGAGRFSLWPSRPDGQLAGRLVFGATAVGEIGPVTLRFRAPGSGVAEVRLRPGRWTRISLPVCARGPWSAEFASDRFAFLEAGVVSARASKPRYERDPGACTLAPTRGTESA